MKKTLLPLSALAMLVLVSCGGPAASSTPAPSSDPGTSSVEQASVAISNKSELTAEWHVLQADRTINVDINPRGNIQQLIHDGILVIKSSDEKVVSVIGRQLHAAGEGNAKITVTYKDKTDTVDIEVGEALVAPDFAKKTLTEIMAYTDLRQNGDNKNSHEAFLTKVKVASLGSKKDEPADAMDQYGNMYVTDPTVENAADKIQVYGCGASASALVYDTAIGAFKYANVKDANTNPATKGIKAGDVLDVIAIRADYKTTPEISFVIRAVNGKLVSNRDVDSKDVETFEFTNNEKKMLYTVSGKISAWKDNKTTNGTKYGNFFLQTDDGKAVYVYGATASSKKTVEGGDPLDVIQLNDDGSFKFNNPQDWLTNEFTKDLAIGDYVTVTGFRCDYQGTVELNGIVSKYIPPKTAIAGVKAGDRLKLAEATVVGITTKSMVITDGTDLIYVYLNAAPAYKVGDVISIDGVVAAYHGYLQLPNTSVHTKLSGKTPKTLTPTALTKELADGLEDASPKLFKWTTVAGKSGNYTTLNVAGSDTLIEPVYVDSKVFSFTEGLQYDVEGAFIGYDTSNKYATFVVTAAEKHAAETPVAKPDAVAASVADLLAMKATVTDKVYTVSGIWEGGTAGDKSGTGYITDAATGKSIAVYRSSGNAESIKYDGTTGVACFSWDGKGDADTTLAGLTNGMAVSGTAIFSVYNNNPQLYMHISSKEASAQKYAVTVEKEGNGTVTLSKEEADYGEEITVTATPDAQNELRKLTVVDAQGKETDITEAKKFKATCVNKVVATFARIDKTVSVGKFTFETPADNTQEVTAADTIKGFFKAGEGATVAVSSVSAPSKVYGAANGGSGDNTWKTNNVLKLGTSSAAGKVTLTLDKAVSKVVINGNGWKNTLKVKVNSVESTAFRTNLANKANIEGKKMDSDAFYLTAPATEITIETVGTSLVINSIEFFAEPAA